MASEDIFHHTENPEWIIWLIWAVVCHYTDKNTHFVRVLTHYGSNDSLRFFCAGWLRWKGADRYSEGLWFRNVFIQEGFYSEGSLFRKVLSWRVIIPKGRYSEVWNNDPFGIKIFGIMILQDITLRNNDLSR